MSKSRVLYSGVEVNPTQQKQLEVVLDAIITSNGLDLDWNKDIDVKCHHMTINLGPLTNEEYIGYMEDEDIISMKVTHYGISDLAIAVKVECPLIKSSNKIPHITLCAITKNGGKPFHSNKITNWTKVNREFYLTGLVKQFWSK